MKKNLLVLILVFLGLNTFSQLSITVENRYGFNMPGSYGMYGNGESSQNGSTGSFKSKLWGVGTGYEGGLGLSYAFKSALSLDLGFSYLLGTPQTTEDNSTYQGPYGMDSRKSTSTFISKMYRGRFGLSYKGSQKIAPVFRAGVIAATGKLDYEYHSKTVYNQLQYAWPNPSTTVAVTHTADNKIEFSKGISLGFYSGVGISYNANENSSWTFMLDMVMQDFTPNKGKEIYSKYDGMLDNPSPTVTYKRKVSSSSPTQAPRISFPLSSFGPSITYRYTFGSKKAEEIKP